MKVTVGEYLSFHIKRLVYTYIGSVLLKFSVHMAIIENKRFGLRITVSVDNILVYTKIV